MGVARSLWREFSEDNVTDLAAGLAYRFLFALFPFVIFLGALTAFVAPAVGVEDPNTFVVENVSTAIPEESQGAVTSQLTAILEQQRPGLLSFGLIAALWAASNGMAATMRALNRVYDIQDQRPYWKKIGIAIGLTLGVGGLALAAMVLAVAGNAITPFLTDTFGVQGGVATAIGIAVDVVRIVAAALLMIAAVGFLFWAGPDAGLPLRWLTWGATLFVVAWLVAAVAFGWYVSNFGNYNATYGALGGLIIAMLWFYISAAMLLVGAELNVILARRRDPEAARALGPSDQEAARQDERAPVAAGSNGSTTREGRAGVAGRQGHRGSPVPPTPVPPSAADGNGRGQGRRPQSDMRQDGAAQDGQARERAGALDALVGAVTLWRATSPTASHPGTHEGNYQAPREESVETSKSTKSPAMDGGD